MKLSITINTEPYEIETDPRNMLLHVLRDELGLMGTKYGCGEGECGACTVILNGRTVNSCLTTIGQAHGGYITTIEGLAATGEGKSLLEGFVDKGAVQCGFCTPGIAVSTSTLVNQASELSEEEIRQGLSGHLCRCTGYVKIVDAVKLISGKRLDLPPIRKTGFLPITDIEGFFRPDNLEDALEALADSSKNWKILAGGTDLYVRHEHRIQNLNLLDISGIEELKGIKRRGADVRIGAGTTFSQLIHSPVIAECYPSLITAARQIGGVQIQNMGTVGGNIANGSPAADIVPSLMSMGAMVEVVSKDDDELIAIDDFFTGLNQTRLKSDWLIRRIILPLPRESGKIFSCFDKLGVRKALTITKASLAMYGVMSDNRFNSLKIALGSVAENVISAPKTAAILMDGELTEQRLNEAGEMIANEVRPIDDMFSTESYCRQAVKGLLIRNLWEHVSR